MNVSNDPADQAAGQFADLLRLQADFQTRIAEETLRYLRAVQSALAPVVPTTVVTVAEGDELQASGAPGERVELQVVVENTQGAHVTATAALTPLVERGGTTWFPVAEPSPPLLLIAPGRTAQLRVGVTLPGELRAGEYRGALLLPGFRHEGVPLVVTVTDGSPDASKAAARTTEAKKTAAKKTAAKKTAAKKTAAKKAAPRRAGAREAPPSTTSAS